MIGAGGGTLPLALRHWDEIHRHGMPQATGHAMMRWARERYGFLTLEVARLVIAHAGELTLRVHGSRSGLLYQLLKHYGLPFLAPSGFAEVQRMAVRNAFELPETGRMPPFATWKHLLLLGMKGRTPIAREIQAYLLRAEEENRVTRAVEEATGFTSRQLEQLAAYLGRGEGAESPTIRCIPR